MKKWTLAILAALAACLVMMGGTKDVEADDLPSEGLDIDTGWITVDSSTTAGKNKVTCGNTVYDQISPAAEIKIIEKTSTSSSNAIVVNTGNGANITLFNVNIQIEQNPAFHIMSSAGPVTLTLADGTTNTLVSKSGDYAGLQKDSTAETSMLTVQSGPLGTGTLTAKGSGGGAGIGGRSDIHFSGPGTECSYITINSGTITANGGTNSADWGKGAGIGGGGGGHSADQGVAGGAGGNCSNITINGGNITANSGKGMSEGGSGAGIGGGGGGGATANYTSSATNGGNGGNCSGIVINGGTITSTGIGGGGGGRGVYAGNGTTGGKGGNGGSCSDITINGGTITQTSIGGGGGEGSYVWDDKLKNQAGGSGGSCLNIKINGGSISASNSIGVTPTNGQGTVPPNVYLTTVTLKNSQNAAVKNTLVSQLATVGAAYYGTKDMYTDAEGKLYLWLPKNTETRGAADSSDNEYTNAALTKIMTNADGNAAGILTETTSLEKVTINYIAGSNGRVSPASEELKQIAGIAAGSKATANAGYHFVSWTDSSGKELSTDAKFAPEKVNGFNVAANYTANFAVNPTYYTITASASPSSGGTVTGGGTYLEGFRVTLKAAAKEGYTFLDWHEDGKSIGTGTAIEIAASGDRTITAHFRASSSVRVFGTTRYDTMAETVKKAFPDGCETAVLASGGNWPDALSASSLAGVKDCPVILTEPGQLTQQTADLLVSLKVTNVIIVGGTAAISDDAKAAVEAKSITTERIWGNDRTQTADLVARRVIDSSDADTIIICSGQNFPDALSISYYAYAKKMPILLAGSDGKLTADSLEIAENFGKAIIVGGEKAVSLDVEKQLTVMKTVRYEGTDRYGTSIDVINKLFGGYAPVLAIATGTNYPDALVGAALAGKSGGTILLVDGSGTSLTDDQKTIIGNAGDVWILGGDGAVSDAMKTAIDDALK